MANVRASIIIPAYNMAHYLETAIRSAQEQTEPAIEILVVDDCSQDDTLYIAEQAAARDPRVRVFRTSANSGPATARNLALANACGDWIVLLDADDRFHPRRIQTLIELGERVRADLVADGLVIVDEAGIQPDRLMLDPDLFPEPRPVIFAEFMQRSLGKRRVARGVSWVGLQPAYRRAFLQEQQLEFNTANRWGEDYLLYVACFLRGALMWVTPEPLYYHTIRRGSLTDTPPLMDLWRIVETDGRLLSDPAVSPDATLRRAVRRHMNAHQRWFYYRRFVEQAKAGSLRQASRSVFENFASLRHVASEAMIQTPRILAKAFRGGYADGLAPPQPKV